LRVSTRARISESARDAERLPRPVLRALRVPGPACARSVAAGKPRPGLGRDALPRRIDKFIAQLARAVGAVVPGAEAGLEEWMRAVVLAVSGHGAPASREFATESVEKPGIHDQHSMALMACLNETGGCEASNMARTAAEKDGVGRQLRQARETIESQRIGLDQ